MKSGFTLAEVLITLVIIGVIAAMTIPAMTNYIDGRQYQAAATKFASSLSQSCLMKKSRGEASCYDDLYSDDSIPRPMFLQATFGVDHLATYTVDASEHGESATAEFNGYVLNDGSVIGLLMGFNNLTFVFDSNGQKGPNKVTMRTYNPQDIYLIIPTIHAQKVNNDEPRDMDYDATPQYLDSWAILTYGAPE